MPEATVGQTLAACAPRLAGGRLEAEVLLGHVLGLDRLGLLRERDRVLDAATAAACLALVARREAGEPVAYLTGRREFWSLMLEVDPRVLVPRPETEVLVETALALAAQAPDGVIVDVGTGSGAIALALALELPTRHVIAVDDSPDALAVAAANVARHAAGRIELRQGDLLQAFSAASLALVVSNPPYVEDDYLGLSTAALCHEPRHALAAGADGLDVIRRLVPQALHALREGGWLALEHGATQGPAVRALLAAAGFRDLVTQRDLAGHERVTAGRRG